MKQLSYIVDFLGLEFNTVKIEVRFLKDKLEKIIKKVVKLLEKRSSTTKEKLQPFVGLLFLATKVVYLGQAFF